jgi:tetratricopeptide (TPR) repeat protein
MRAALEWASDYDAEITVRLMFALRRFWYIRGRDTENSKWQEKVLAKGNEVPAIVRARALHLAGESAAGEGNDELAQSYMEECIALAHQAGDKALVSNAQGQLGYMFLQQANYAKAKELFEACLTLDRELGNSYGVCWLLTALGEVARSEGDYAQAWAYYEEGLVLAREAENKYNIAHLVGNLGSVALAQGDDRRATPLILESLTLSQELGYEVGVAGCLARLVGIFVARGQPDRAAKLSGAVNRLLQTLDARLEAADHSVYERDVAAAHEQLDDERWSAAWAEGQAMMVEEAITNALEWYVRDPGENHVGFQDDQQHDVGGEL